MHIFSASCTISLLRLSLSFQLRNMIPERNETYPDFDLLVEEGQITRQVEFILAAVTLEIRLQHAIYLAEDANDLPGGVK